MSAGERPNILLVDDIPQNLLALEAVLEPLGCNLSRPPRASRRSGTPQGRFALVLLDVQMPELDGFETAALIKQRERTRTRPHHLPHRRQQGLEQIFRGYSGGAVDYISSRSTPSCCARRSPCSSTCIRRPSS